jgi:hypothetical protein
LVAPAGDPHFRLQALTHLPVDYRRPLQSAKPLIDSIMILNQAAPQWNALPWSRIQQLWRQRRLPWTLANLQELDQLRQLDRHSVVLNWLGSSTGSLPTVAVTGHSQYLPQVLAALNIALWYIHTTPPPTVAALVAPSDPAPMDREISQGLHEALWPAVTQISPAEYNRGRALYGLAGTLWPPYYSGTDSTASRQAFNAKF